MKRLRVDFASPPFAGHLYPILGLARLLSTLYEVRVLTTRSALPAVRAAGVEGVALLDGCEQHLEALANTPTAVRSNPARLLAQVRGALELQRRLGVELRGLYQAVRPRLLIADFTLPAAGAAACYFGVPWWTSLPSPCVLETRDGPPPYLGGLSPRIDALGRVRDALGRLVTRSFKRLTGRLFRSKLREIGFDALYRADGSEALYSNRRILALGAPSLEFCKNWPGQLRMVPMPLYTPDLGTAEPPFLPRKAHVLITMGTHLTFVKARILRAAERMATHLPHLEFHFSMGAVANTSVRTVRNLTQIGFVNYEKYLSRYELIVHHGGAGVMYHALSAGVPAVVYPVDYDQFDHAARLEHYGLAVRLHHEKDLQAAVRGALQNIAMRERCRQFARQYLNVDDGHLLAEVCNELSTPPQGNFDSSAIEQ